jgi:hypothetical protein
MPVPYVEVVAPDGTSELVDLGHERVVVGSAPSSHVVVARPEVGQAHMLLSPRPEGCYAAAARNAPTPILYAGRPFERGVVPWGGELAIGPVRFVLHDGSVPREVYLARAAGKPPGASNKQGVSPVVLVATLVIVPTAGWLLLQEPEGQITRTDVPPPPLFDALERPCPQHDPLDAQALAAESARKALARAERMPFHSQDGVAAVGDFAVAAGCYRAAGDPAEAEGQLAAARTLAGRIDDEYRNHRFRLEHALEQDKTDDALVEIRLLRHLLVHRPGPYLDWLVTLERQLMLKAEEAAREANQ